MVEAVTLGLTREHFTFLNQWDNVTLARIESGGRFEGAGPGDLEFPLLTSADEGRVYPLKALHGLLNAVRLPFLHPVYKSYVEVYVEHKETVVVQLVLVWWKPLHPLIWPPTVIAIVFSAVLAYLAVSRLRRVASILFFAGTGGPCYAELRRGLWLARHRNGKDCDRQLSDWRVGPACRWLHPSGT